MVCPRRDAPEDLDLGYLHGARGQDEVNHGSFMGVRACSPLCSRLARGVCCVPTRSEPVPV